MTRGCLKKRANSRYGVLGPGPRPGGASPSPTCLDVGPPKRLYSLFEPSEDTAPEPMINPQRALPSGRSITLPMIAITTLLASFGARRATAQEPPGASIAIDSVTVNIT